MGNAQGGHLGGQLATPFEDSGQLGWELTYRRDNGAAFAVDSATPAVNTITTATPVYLVGERGPTDAINGFAESNVPLDAAASGQPQAGPLNNNAYCFPQILPPGRLMRVLTLLNGGGQPANSKARYAVYGNKDGPTNMNLYPYNLLYDCGEVDYPSNFAPKEAVIPGGLYLTGGLYWFAVNFNTASSGASTASIVGVSRARIHPVGGRTISVDAFGAYNTSHLIGWAHALTFGAYPSLFPITAPKRIFGSNAAGSADIPAIFFGYSTDK